MDCILNDHTVVTFLPPLDLDVITQSWIAQASTMPQTRQIILTTTEDDSEATVSCLVQAPNTLTLNHLTVQGVVMLSAQRSQTWAFQRTSGEATRVAKPSAEVGTAFRSIRVQTSHYATRGLATRLMRKLEEIAQQKGITNLVNHSLLLSYLYSTLKNCIDRCSTPNQEVLQNPSTLL